MVVIHNKTEVGFTLRAYHNCRNPALEGFYAASGQLHVPARAKKTVPFWSRLLDVSGYCKEIHVIYGEVVMMVLHADDLKNNEGRDFTIFVTKALGLNWLNVVFKGGKSGGPIGRVWVWSGAHRSPELVPLLELQEERDRKEKQRKEEGKETWMKKFLNMVFHNNNKRSSEMAFGNENLDQYSLAFSHYHDLHRIHSYRQHHHRRHQLLHIRSVVSHHIDGS